MIFEERMILIGSPGQNSGKTTLAVEMINRWKDQVPIVALKITTVKQSEIACPRGDTGCGGCSGFSSDYTITEEGSVDGDKDTMRLLRAGARQVFWMRSRPEFLREGFIKFLEWVPGNALILCESNSLREHVVPGCFIMVGKVRKGKAKPSALSVVQLADILVENLFEQTNLDSILSQIQVACKATIGLGDCSQPVI